MRTDQVKKKGVRKTKVVDDERMEIREEAEQLVEHVRTENRRRRAREDEDDSNEVMPNKKKNGKKEEKQVERTDKEGVESVSKSTDKVTRPEDKITRIKGRWTKSTDIRSEDARELNKALSRLNSNHRGEVTLGVKLKDSICSKNKESNTFKIISIINKEGFGIDKIISRGYNTAEIKFINIHEANRCIDRYSVMCEQDKAIEIYTINKSMRAKGIIKDWDRSTPLQELASAIDDSRGVISLERMMIRRFNKEDRRSEWRLGNNIIITVEGTIVPSELSLWGRATGIKIKPYIERVVQCFNCYRYGHVANICRSKKKCAVCGEDYHERCTEAERCINCGQGHRADNRECEVFHYNKQLKTIMAEYSINIYEAKRKWEELYGNINTRTWNIDSRKEIVKDVITAREWNSRRIREQTEPNIRPMGISKDHLTVYEKDSNKLAKISVSKQSKVIESKDSDNDSEVETVVELMKILINKLNKLEKGQGKKSLVKGLAEALKRLVDNESTYTTEEESETSVNDVCQMEEENNTQIKYNSEVVQVEMHEESHQYEGNTTKQSQYNEERKDGQGREGSYDKEVQIYME